MSVLFCHDHRFFRAADGRRYSYGQFDRDILGRYAGHFGKLAVASRQQPMPGTDDISHLSDCTRPDTTFIDMPDMSSLRTLLVGDPTADARLRKAMAGCDYVIARLPSEIGLAACRIAREMGNPYLVEVVACVWDGLMSHGGTKARAYAPLAYWRMRREVARADYVLYVTRHFLQKRYPTTGAKASVSNVQLDEIDPTVAERKAAAATAPLKAPVFGIISPLFHAEKGLDVAMAALASVRADAPGATLLVLGAGDAAPWKAKAHELGLGGDAVRFVGTLPRGGAVMGWMDGLDIFLVPSFQEGLPRGLIEAMSRGLPALGSTVGGIPELLEPAMLHKAGDARMLAAQMAKLAAEPDLRAAQSRRNFEIAATYTPEALAAERRRLWGLMEAGPKA